MPLRAIARLIQTMLYAQRFFPYYVYNILGGIEEDGESHSSISRGEMHGTGRPLLLRTSECAEAPASDTSSCLSFVKQGNGHPSVRSWLWEETRIPRAPCARPLLHESRACVIRTTMLT